jgi:hypothetical protein
VAISVSSGGNSGGISGAHIEQTMALKAGHAYTLSFWAADLGSNEFDPLYGSPGHVLQVPPYGQASGELLSQAVLVAPRGTCCGSAHELQFLAPSNDSATLKFYFGGRWTKLKSSRSPRLTSRPGRSSRRAQRVAPAPTLRSLARARSTPTCPESNASGNDAQRGCACRFGSERSPAGDPAFAVGLACLRRLLSAARVCTGPARASCTV